MHVLFVHQNFPAQFGHIGSHMVKHRGHRCTFVSEKPPRIAGGVECIQYTTNGGAQESTHYCSRTFENQIWHSAAALEALQRRPDIQPDLIVGHSGFLSTVFLRELYDAPQINYFEFFYRTRNSDFDFRSDLPLCGVKERIRARVRNAALLLDLNNCDSGYSPTDFQRSQLPTEFQEKLNTIFDGIDTDFWKPIDNPPRKIGGWELPRDKRIITYVSRGMESIRGFDVFMKIAKQISEQRSGVLFVVVGEDRVAYGGDMRFTGGRTFKQWVLEQDNYDLQNILFVGRIPPVELVRLFSLTDLHLFLTAPFVLSWSLFDALACSTTVLASQTAPVEELIEDGVNGLLTDFFDVEAWTKTAMQVLNAPGDYKYLGTNGATTIAENYSLDVCLPKLMNLYETTLSSSP